MIFRHWPSVRVAWCLCGLAAVLPFPAVAETADRLEPSGPVVVAHDGQVIENIRIRAAGVPAITVANKANVVIRNVSIVHEGAPGIACVKAEGLVIDRVSITNARAIRGGSNPNNIDCRYSDSLAIRHARLERGASGAYVLESRNARLSFIEGYDFVGGPPRGQLVQFDKSNGCVLEDFSVINAAARSWPEDNVSVYESDDCIVRRGLVHGNSSPSGVGVMFERSSNGLVEDVDAVRQGNGSFSAYPGQRVTFRRTNTRDNLCGDQGRGPPMSKSLLWAGSPDSRRLRIEQSRYVNACNAGNIVWYHPAFDIVDVMEDDFVTRRPIRNSFSFDSATGGRPPSGDAAR
jgi:hypothetical protein